MVLILASFVFIPATFIVIPSSFVFIPATFAVIPGSITFIPITTIKTTHPLPRNSQTNKQT